MVQLRFGCTIMECCRSSLYAQGLMWSSWFAISVNCLAISPELKLWNHLMTTTGYNRNIRPVLDDPNKQTNVVFGFQLGQLESLNEKSQVMTTFGWMNLHWKDELLAWDPAAFSGVSKIVVPGKLIWLPDLVLVNSAEQGGDLTATIDHRAAIYSNGYVSWVPGFKWQTSCTVDLTAFPFDTQGCYVGFTNWAYFTNQVNFSLLSDTVDLSGYDPSKEWDIVDATTNRTEYVSEYGSMPTVSFVLRLKRKPEFYVMNIVVPCLIMTIVSAMVFCLPAESGEKIGLGITVLLAYSVVLLIISDITPRSSSMPVLTVCIVASMALTTMSLVASVLVLSVYHHNPKTPVPKWIRTVFLMCFARCLLMGRGGTRGEVRLEPSYTYAGKHEKPINTKNEGQDSSKGSGISQSITEYRLPDELLAFLKGVKETELKTEVIEQNREDWQLLASVVDRLFFIAFFIVLVVGFTVIATVFY